MLAWERRRAVRTQPLRTENRREKCGRACVIYDCTLRRAVSLRFFRGRMSISRVSVRYKLATSNTQRRKPMKRHLLVMATVVLAAAAVHAAASTTVAITRR